MPRTARRVKPAKALLFAKSLPLRKSYFSRTGPARSISRHRRCPYHVSREAFHITNTKCSISRTPTRWRSISRRFTAPYTHNRLGVTYFSVSLYGKNEKILKKLLTNGVCACIIGVQQIPLYISAKHLKGCDAKL